MSKVTRIFSQTLNYFQKQNFINWYTIPMRTRQSKDFPVGIFVSMLFCQLGKARNLR